MSDPVSPAFTRRRALAVGTAACLLSGCSAIQAGTFGPGPAPQLYVLDPPLPAASGAPKVTWQLAVATPAASAALDTARIALSMSPNTMDYYANAAWQDQAPALVQDFLTRAFQAGGRIVAVSRDSSGVGADYLLESDLRDFEARYASPQGPPEATVGLTCRLMRVSDRRVVAAGHFVQATAAQANTLDAVVTAFDAALAAVLAQAVDWTLAAPPPG